MESLSLLILPTFCLKTRPVKNAGRVFTGKSISRLSGILWICLIFYLDLYKVLFEVKSKFYVRKVPDLNS